MPLSTPPRNVFLPPPPIKYQSEQGSSRHNFSKGSNKYYMGTVFIVVFYRTCSEVWVCGSFRDLPSKTKKRGSAILSCLSRSCPLFSSIKVLVDMTHGDNIDNFNLHTFSGGSTVRYNCRRVHTSAIIQ